MSVQPTPQQQPQTIPRVKHSSIAMPLGQVMSTDSDGDKSRLNFVRGESTPQGFNGTVEIVGLTGKYEKVKGTCTYDLVRLVLNSTIHLSNHVKCSVSK